jgi:pyridoxal phosphate enzyme (YggS family)
LRIIRDLLAETAVEAGRRPGDVHLLAVSKKQPLEKIVEAAAAGQLDFGENIVQEGIEKVTKLAEKGLCWHFIGHLQSNKTRPVAEHFDWVHSVDTIKTARRLSEQRPESLGDLNVCIQVNIDEEASKSGVPPSDVAELASCACLRCEIPLTNRERRSRARANWPNRLRERASSWIRCPWG